MSADRIERHVIMGALIPALMELFLAQNLYHMVCPISGTLILGVIPSFHSPWHGGIVKNSAIAGIIIAPLAQARPGDGPLFTKECDFHGKF
jgi:hypothetical protein